MTHRLIQRACFGATAFALVALLPVSLTAQKGALAPTDVTIVGAGNSATVSWTPVPVKGVTYRVLRGLEARAPGEDLTRPIEAVSFVDPKVEQGVTYFYQVIVVYDDGTSAAAAPVAFTLPSVSPGTPTPAFGRPIGRAPGAPGPRVAIPTAVTGIMVNGTTASATVSWQPVPGAVSYSVTRSTPDGYVPTTFPGLTTPTWIDPGPRSIGFEMAGVYGYLVTASLGGGASVSGQVNWTRPNPTCAAPLPNQPMLTLLDPTSRGPITHYGPYPSGAVFAWQNNKIPGASVIAFRMERSVQGTNAWTLAATSCGGTLPIVGTGNMAFIDGLGGIVPNTAYLYRLTAIAPTGEMGAGTIPWTSPSAVLLRWLSATVVGSTVTLKVRYEPPATNAPIAPTSIRVTSSSGSTQTPSGGPCAGLAGCSFVFPTMARGTHQFTVIATWTSPMGSGQALDKTTAETTVVVP